MAVLVRFYEALGPGPNMPFMVLSWQVRMIRKQVAHEAVLLNSRITELFKNAQQQVLEL